MATLQRTDGTVEVPDQLPVIALRDLVFFPYMVLPLLIGRAPSVAALQEAEAAEGLVLLVAQRDAAVEDPGQKDVYRVGTVIRVVQITPLPDGTARVVMEGLGRARIKRFLPKAKGFKATVELVEGGEVEAPAGVTADTEALARGVRRLFEEYVQLNQRLPRELVATLDHIDDRVRLAHVVSGHLILNASEKQEVLEAASLDGQLEILQEILIRELEILRIEEKLDLQIQQQMDSGRRQFYLQEQLKAISKELGATEGEWAELEVALRDAPLPHHVRERAERELDRLRRLNPVAPEAAVIRTYLDWILGLPWMGKTRPTSAWRR